MLWIGWRVGVGLVMAMVVMMVMVVMAWLEGGGVGCCIALSCHTCGVEGVAQISLLKDLLLLLL